MLTLLKRSCWPEPTLKGRTLQGPKLKGPTLNWRTLKGLRRGATMANPGHG
jgi:hypothetical protein